MMRSPSLLHAWRQHDLNLFIERNQQQHRSEAIKTYPPLVFPPLFSSPYIRPKLSTSDS
jgi:hypothetical protein